MQVLDKLASRRGPTGRSLPAYRIGDVALFLIWMAFAIAAVVGATKLVQSHDIPAAAYRMMVAIVFVVEGALFLLRGPAVRHGEGLVPKFAALIGTWAIIPLASLPLTWHPGWLLLLSTVGLLAIDVIVLWALVTLRGSFSIFPEGRQLIRHGPYRLVRHPLYAVYFAMYVLIALPRLSPAALALAVVGIGAEVLRAHRRARASCDVSGLCRLRRDHASLLAPPSSLDFKWAARERASELAACSSPRSFLLHRS